MNHNNRLLQPSEFLAVTDLASLQHMAAAANITIRSAAAAGRPHPIAPDVCRVESLVRLMTTWLWF